MYKNNFCPKVAQKKFYLCIIIFGDKIPHNRYRLLAYRPTHTTYPIIPIERHKFSKRHVFHVAWRCFAIAQHDRHVSFRARPVGRRGVSMSSRTHVRDLMPYVLAGDSSRQSLSEWQEGMVVFHGIYRKSRLTAAFPVEGRSFYRMIVISSIRFLAPAYLSIMKST